MAERSETQLHYSYTTRHLAAILSGLSLQSLNSVGCRKLQHLLRTDQGVDLMELLLRQDPKATQATIIARPCCLGEPQMIAKARQ